MKNEAPYILEWVAHHLAIGFDHIVAFTNDCTDTTNEILTRLQELGHVTLQPNHSGPGGIHRTALRQARRMDVVKNAGWLYVTDADEFLNIHVGDHSVDALIEASGGENVDVIGIPWRIFSFNQRTILRDSPITERFTDAEITYEDGGAGRRFVKSLFRNKPVFRRIGLHNPQLREEHKDELNWALPGAVQTSSTPMGNHVPPPFGHEIAQINHYAVRSAQGYLLKKFRGRANHQSHVLESGYWERWNRGGQTDTTIQQNVPGMKDLLSEFMADPALRTHHRRGFKWHKNTLAQLLTDPEYSALLDTISRSTPARVVQKDRAIRVSNPSAVQQQTEQPTNLPTIATLWVEGPLSFVEQLCLLSFVAAGHPVRLYHYGRVDNVPDGIEVVDAREIHDPKTIIYNKQFKTPVVQSDIFRLHLMKKTDCIWVDSDMLCLRPFVPKDGYLFGYFRPNDLCNAVIRLPKDSPGLKAYLDFTEDEYPISPAVPEEERAALRASGKIKHASEQAHSVYGPGVFTWFMRESGEIAHADPVSAFYPVPFRRCGEISDLHSKTVRENYLDEDTMGVHLWGRRFRWWVAGRGIARHSMIDRRMRALGLQADLAPIPTARSPFPDGPSFPIDLPAQQTSADEIAAAVDAIPEDINALGAYVRMAERVLPRLKQSDRYGISQPVDPDHPRMIDDYQSDAALIYLLATQMKEYHLQHHGLLDFLNPTTSSEMRFINDIFRVQDRGRDLQQSNRWRFTVIAGQVALVETYDETGEHVALTSDFQPVDAKPEDPRRRRPRSYERMVEEAESKRPDADYLWVDMINRNGVIEVT